MGLVNCGIAILKSLMTTRKADSIQLVIQQPILKIAGGFKCINIKWHLNALALPFFKRFLKDWSDFSLEEFVGKSSFAELSDLELNLNSQLNVKQLDKIFEKAILKNKIDSKVAEMVSLSKVISHMGLRFLTWPSLCVSLQRH